eukprot:gene2653-biopygen14125
MCLGRNGEGHGNVVPQAPHGRGSDKARRGERNGRACQGRSSSRVQPRRLLLAARHLPLLLDAVDLHIQPRAAISSREQPYPAASSHIQPRAAISSREQTLQTSLLRLRRAEGWEDEGEEGQEHVPPDENETGSDLCRRAQCASEDSELIGGSAFLATSRTYTCLPVGAPRREALLDLLVPDPVLGLRSVLRGHLLPVRPRPRACCWSDVRSSCASPLHAVITDFVQHTNGVLAAALLQLREDAPVLLLHALRAVLREALERRAQPLELLLAAVWGNCDSDCGRGWNSPPLGRVWGGWHPSTILFRVREFPPHQAPPPHTQRTPGRGPSSKGGPQTSLAVVQLDWLNRLGQFCQLRQHGQFSEGTDGGWGGGVKGIARVSMEIFQSRNAKKTPLLDRGPPCLMHNGGPCFFCPLGGTPHPCFAAAGRIPRTPAAPSPQWVSSRRAMISAPGGRGTVVQRGLCPGSIVPGCARFCLNSPLSSPPKTYCKMDLPWRTAVLETGVAQGGGSSILVEAYDRGSPAARGGG